MNPPGDSHASSSWKTSEQAKRLRIKHFAEYGGQHFPARKRPEPSAEVAAVTLGELQLGVCPRFPQSSAEC